MSAQQQQQQQQVQMRPWGQHQQHQQQQQQPWWAGPLHGIGSALQGVQHNLQQLANNLPKPPHQQPAARTGATSNSSVTAPPPQQQQHQSHTAVAAAASASTVAAAHSSSSSSSPQWSNKQQQQSHHLKPVTKEELGRSTWVFLHTLAAQFPERPTRQQQRDARQLMDALTRIYPCADCAQHFQEIVRRDPPDVSSGAAFSQWMCRTHNAVNRRLGKPTFNCDLVGARWAPLDCDTHNSCDMTVGQQRPR